MKRIKSLLSLFNSSHTLSQKLNYMHYIFSKKGKILNYQPITISIVTTGRCTLSCDMCPTHSRVIPKDYPHIQRPTKDMSLETFKQVVDKFNKALHVHIIGSGEPLLNKDFFKMVEYATLEKHMRVKTFSNGTTIEKYIDKIVNSSLDGITISLNGQSEEEFSRMTGCPKFVYPKIYKATENLIQERNRSDSKVKIKLSFIIDKINYKYIPDMINIGEKLGADFIFLCNFLPSPFDGFSAEERMLFTDDGYVINTIKQTFSNIPKTLKRKISFPKLISRNSTKINCNCHFSQIRVDGEGRISSCSMMLLNMDDQGYLTDRDVWNNDFFKEMRQKFLSSNKHNLLAPCIVCPDNFGVSLNE